jgi:hypothetical protein
MRLRGNANTADRETDTEEDTEEKKLENEGPDEDEEENWKLWERRLKNSHRHRQAYQDALVELKGSPSTLS